MTYKLGALSLSRLQGVHPDLVRVVKRAIEITEVDFVVVEGVRSLEQQKKNVAKGVSKTMNSRHLVADNGYSHAVDLVPYIDGKAVWDWPPIYKIAKAMKQAAKELGIAIEWGGDWKSFKDGPHWQLPWKQYPSQGPVKGPKYTGETDAQARTQAFAAVGAGAAAAAPVATEPLVRAVDAISGQQSELSSGDAVRVALAAFIVLATVYLAWRKLQ